MKNQLIIIFLFFVTLATAQTNPEITAPANEQHIYNIGGIEVNPEYPGGIGEFYKYVANNFQLPKNFKGVGKVIVQFVVEKDGNLSSFKVIRGMDPEVDAEAIRILKDSKRWSPGIQDGRFVRVQFALPLSIQSP